jgi:lipoprotein-anchoring transpeptidase ErfK/SrfK
MNLFALNRIVTLALVVFAAASLSSCSSTKGSGGARYSTTFDPPATKPTNPSAVRVKISTGAQRLYVTEGGKVLLATPCSVGMPGHSTPPGNHTIYSKEARRRSHSYGEYPMPFWCEFSPAYGIHVGFVKPYPCTHGCVRLPKMAAAKVFAMVNTSTPVNVSSSQAEDATIGKTLPVLDDTTLPDPPNSFMMSNQVFEDAQYKGKMFNN